MISLSVIFLITLLVISLPVGVVLVALGISLSELYSFFPLLPASGEILWSSSTEFVLVAVPMFILMGEILLRSGVVVGMYQSLDSWVNKIPGGLIHTNIAACSLFSATSGSSVATAATIGTVAIPNMRELGYDRRLYLGSIAAGGTLGILIPPSINLILFGVLAEVSITRLYLASLLPGICLAASFSLAVFLFCLFKPSLGGNITNYSWRDRVASLKNLAAPIGLFTIVVGSIYAGYATPTEAAALGVVASLAIGVLKGEFSIIDFYLALEGAMRTTAMVMLIVMSAFFLNFVMVSIGLTGIITDFMKGLNFSPIIVIFIIVIVYLVLGCFMETLSLMIATTPIVAPIVAALGFDLVWFGVLFMILIEAALITPPIGVNLFVVQSVRNQSDIGPMRDVMIGVTPFLFMMLIMIGVLIAFPSLALWLPEMVMQ